MKNKARQNPIITVIGHDSVGLVAQISNLLWKKSVNIEEIKQGIIKEEFFMIMAVNLDNASCDFEQLSRELKQLSAKLNLDISIYNKEIFSAINKL